MAEQTEAERQRILALRRQAKVPNFADRSLAHSDKPELVRFYFQNLNASRRVLFDGQAHADIPREAPDADQ